jgi:hypothetical protein
VLLVLNKIVDVLVDFLSFVTLLFLTMQPLRQLLRRPSLFLLKIFISLPSLFHGFLIFVPLFLLLHCPDLLPVLLPTRDALNLHSLVVLVVRVMHVSQQILFRFCSKVSLNVIQLFCESGFISGVLLFGASNVLLFLPPRLALVLAASSPVRITRISISR